MIWSFIRRIPTIVDITPLTKTTIKKYIANLLLSDMRISLVLSIIHIHPHLLPLGQESAKFPHQMLASLMSGDTNLLHIVTSGISKPKEHTFLFFLEKRKEKREEMNFQSLRLMKFDEPGAFNCIINLSPFLSIFIACPSSGE
jgi:hypothetical protein